MTGEVRSRTARGLARDVARAVRARVGRDLAVTAKLNLHDGVRGGSSLEDCIAVARMLEQDGALDALELTAGSSLLNPMYLFRGEAPLAEFAAQFPQPLRLGLKLFGGSLLRAYPYEELYLLPMARAVRKAVQLPLILLGGITDARAIQRAMAEGFEFVAMGRALLKEPDLVARLRQDAETRSTCTHCNRCMPTIYTGTRCPLNDAANGDRAS